LRLRWTEPSFRRSWCSKVSHNFFPIQIYPTTLSFCFSAACFCFLFCINLNKGPLEQLLTVCLKRMVLLCVGAVRSPMWCW
jgi:hypothetical protein